MLGNSVLEIECMKRGMGCRIGFSLGGGRGGGEEG